MFAPDTLSFRLPESFARGLSRPRLRLPVQLWPLLALAVAAILVLLFVLLAASWRYWRLRRVRQAVTESAFAEDLSRYGFDPRITSTTYRYLRETLRVPFPLFPGDLLDEDLGLTPEEVDVALETLAAALGRDWSPGIRSSPTVTVEDMLRLLQACPRYERDRIA